MNKTITTEKGTLVKITEKNENEVFEQSAKALFSILTKNTLIQPIKSAKFNLTAEKLDNLLEKYLDELIKISNEKKIDYSKFRVKISKVNKEENVELFNLEGVIFGEKAKEKRVFIQKIKDVKINIQNGEKIFAEFFVEK